MVCVDSRGPTSIVSPIIPTVVGGLLIPVSRRANTTSSPSWFCPALVAVTGLGLLARIGFVFSIWSDKPGGDAPSYRQTAAALASGKGYASAFFGSARLVPTAEHPPLFPMVLALFDLLGLHSVDSQRVALAVLATSAVAVMGFLGRKVAGPTVGIAAAAIAAVDPLWFQSSGDAMSESLLLVIVPVMLLLALRCVERPSTWRFAGLGLIIAAAALTCSETVDFVLVLGVPVVVFAAGPWRRRAVLGLALVAGFAVLMGPWLVRNEVQLGGLVLSDDSGVTLIGAYSPETFDPNNPAYGSFDGVQAEGVTVVTLLGSPPDRAKAWSQVTLNNVFTAEAKQFAFGHLADMPGVVLAREGLIWGLFHPHYELLLSESAGPRGQSATLDQLGQVLYWIKIPFVVVGLVVLMRRSRKRFVIIFMPILVVAFNAALFYGPTRFRVVAEPSLAVLAAMGALAGAMWIRDALKPRVRSAAG